MPPGRIASKAVGKGWITDFQGVGVYADPDLASLAASLGYGLARNHPFVDGNKRTAFVAVETFLLLNGAALVAGDAECVLMMELRRKNLWVAFGSAGLSTD